MADDNATKAPESDAQQDQPIIPGDTPAQSGVTMGFSEHCVTDRPLASGQSATGEVIKLSGIDVYISKPADYPHTPSPILLLLTNGVGINSLNNRLQADRFASENYLVLMPDLFAGDTAPGAASSSIPDVDAEAGGANTENNNNNSSVSSILEQVKLKAVEVTKSFFVDMWLAKITPDKVMPRLHKVIEAAHEQYADAVKTGGGIYAVGYCVGGRFVLLLGKEVPAGPHDEDGVNDVESVKVKKGPYIKAGAVAHAASVAPEDFDGVSVPMSLVCVEDDPLFPDEVRKYGEDVMSKKDLAHEVSVYPGVPHGFAVTGEYEDQTIQDAQGAAYDQMLKWLKDH